MARGDYAWYGDWMDDHYQPWIDLKKRTSDALSSWKKASAHAQSYLGGRTAGTQDEFEEAMRRYDASSAAHSKYQALTDQEAEMFSGAGKDKAIAAFDAWSNFKPESESEPEPTKPDFPYSGLLEPVESKDTGGGFIKNEDTGEVTNIGESKYHRIINEDGTGTIFPITGTTWSDFYQTEDEPIGDTMGEIAEQKPGQSPGDDRTKEPYDKDWPPPAPLKPKFDLADSSEEIAQIASSEGLQPGMIPSLEDNIARDTKQQRLAQETGTAIRQLETDQRSSEPTLAERLAGLDQTIEDNTYTTGDKIKDFAKEFAKNTPGVLGGITERLASIPVGAIPLGRSMLHTAGWTQGTEDNPMRIDLTPGASRQARDRANEYINSLSGTEIAKIREDGRLSDTQLSQLTTAIQPNQTGTEWNYTMNSLSGAYPRIDLEDDPRNPGNVRVKRLHDNFQFDSEKDVSFDLPGKPIQKAVEFFQNQNIKNDPLRATYELDQSDPCNTRNTRRLPSYHEFNYDRPPGRIGSLPTIPKSNKAMKGKSIGNVGGRKLYSIPSFNQF